jgi:hypothetical protein
MQISFITVYGPEGSKEFCRSSLSIEQAESLVTTAISAVTNKLLDVPSSSFLGLLHRSAGIQLYAYVSSTGWLLLIGLESGPYDSDEIARSFFERAMSAISKTCLNPFFTTLDSSTLFLEQIQNDIQSHSVMMRFMASSQTIT